MICSPQRMLRPLYRPNFHPGMKLSKAPSEAATTEYKVLSRNMTAALLECTPLTSKSLAHLEVYNCLLGFSLVCLRLQEIMQGERAGCILW